MTAKKSRAAKAAHSNVQEAQHPEPEAAEEKDVELDTASDFGVGESAEAVENAGQEGAIETLEGQLVEERERYLRLMAEYDNFRRRKAREAGDMRALIADQVVLALLPALDDLDRILSTSGEETSGETVLKGVTMVADKFRTQLAQLGVTDFASVGESFDPERHEALSTCALEEHADDEIVDEHLKGYLRGKTVIRHAQVIVNKR